MAFTYVKNVFELVCLFFFKSAGSHINQKVWLSWGGGEPIPCRLHLLAPSTVPRPGRAGPSQGTMNPALPTSLIPAACLVTQAWGLGPGSGTRLGPPTIRSFWSLTKTQERMNAIC